MIFWQPLTNVSNVSYEYEVAYSVDPECSGDHVISLPDGYTLYYPRISNHYIEVVGLVSGTCYVFGVRAYTSVTDSPGEFSLIQGNTTSYEGCNNTYYNSQLMILSHLLIWDILTLDTFSSSTQSSTGLVVGSVTLSVVIVTLIVLLIVQSMGMIYMKKYVI